jgi:hypothetical protein
MGWCWSRRTSARSGRLAPHAEAQQR